MITRVELENFMSHTHSVFELAEGLTVLLGDNNSGKSAVVHAIQCLCENTSGKYMIRHGTRECIVTIATSEGDEISWHRTKTTAWYIINGKKHSRLKGRVPDELHQVLRLPALTDENQKESYNVHFAFQKQPIFLLHDTGGKRATFFASSSDAGKLMAMQVLHKQQTTAARARERELSNRVEDQAATVASLAAVPELDPSLQKLEQQHDALAADLQTETELGILLERTERNQRLREIEAAQHEILAELPTMPAALTPAGFEKVKRLAELIRRTEIGERFVEQTIETTQVLCGLEPPPVIADSAPLTRLLSAFESVAAEHLKPADTLILLNELPAFPDLLDHSALSTTTRDLESYENLRAGDAAKRATLLEHEQQAEAEWKAMLAELEICPICRQEVPVA